MLHLLSVKGIRLEIQFKELCHFQTGFVYQGKDCNEVSQVKSTETDPYNNINITHIYYKRDRQQAGNTALKSFIEGA